MKESKGLVPGYQTPQYYVASHPITMELTKLGLTDDQLAAIRFRGISQGGPFDDWSYTWGNGMPLEALPFVKAYSALKWLILGDPPPSRDKEDAWRYVNDALLAPIVAVGLKHKQSQGRRAQRPRGKVTDDGQTLKQLVNRLVRNPEHREERTSELWSHLFALLDELELDPKEVAHSDRRKQRYEYLFGAQRRKISYGQFMNLVCHIRSGKSG